MSAFSKVFSADGNSDEFDWPGGLGYFIAQGTFDSGTFKLQFNSYGSNWSDVDDETTLTAGGGGRFFLPPCKIRINASGSSSPDVQAQAVKYEG